MEPAAVNPVLRCCLCVLAGVLAPQLISFPWGSDLFIVLFVAGIALVRCIRRQDIVLFCAGAALFMVAAEKRIESRIESGYVGDSLLATVDVVNFPHRYGTTVRFDAIARDDRRLHSRIRLSWFDPPVNIAAGDVWQVELRLRQPRGNSNPGSPDIEARLFAGAIGATGYVVAGKHNRLLDSGNAGGLLGLRQRLVERIRRVLGESASAAVLTAITVGARHALSDEQWQRFAATGTSHLMAISGLHIGLAALGAYAAATLAFGLLGVRGNQHAMAIAVGLGVAVSYATVSGLALPARRAALMLALLTYAIFRRRQSDGARVLAIVALLVCAFDPISTLTAGFRLSFAAVAALLWLARRRTAEASSWWQRPIVGTRQLAVAQLALFCALLPIVVLTFSRVSLAAPVVNLVAVPLFSFVVVPLALLGLLLGGPLIGIGDPLLLLAGAGIDAIDIVIGAAASFDGSSPTVAAIESSAWLFLLLPLAWIVLPPRWPGRHIAWLSLAALLGWRPQPPPETCVDVHVLDVGQGAAVVVRTHAHTLLYDSGPAYRSGGDAAASVILPFLRDRGVVLIDRLVVSHADIDHAGGVPSLVNGQSQIDVREILSGEPLQLERRNAIPCAAGQKWRWDGVLFSVLHPRATDELRGNDASCVILIETGERRILLTGDIEATIEARLVRDRVLPRVDIATVPHHGSRTSSIAPFTRSLQPRFAIVSAAHDNRWGFPKADVVARWQLAGAEVLNTASSGAIRTRLCAHDDVSEPVRHRLRQSRIWHAD